MKRVPSSLTMYNNPSSSQLVGQWIKCEKKELANTNIENNDINVFFILSLSFFLELLSRGMTEV